MIYNEGMEKIIWQTHEWELTDLPDEFKASMDSWRTLNPGWDYRYVSARERLEHIEQYYEKDLLKFYKQCDKLTQSDLWRYLILYKFGGVYSDMDWKCIRPIDDVMMSEYKENSIMLYDMGYREIHPFMNGVIGSNSSQPVFKELIDSAIEKFKSLPEDRPDEHCGNGCCYNNGKNCNGRNDYYLGYKYFSILMEKNIGSVNPVFNFVALQMD